MQLHYITGPLIGAIIGYFTNWIAVKMLFFPKYEKRVFGFKIPFTPGAIPKGKERLARGIAKTVSKNLVTEESITSRLLDDTSKARVLEELKLLLQKSLREDIRSISGSDAEYEKIRTGIRTHMTGSIVQALKGMDLGEVISEEAKRVILRKTEDSMLRILMTEKVIRGITEPIKEETEKFLELKAPSLIEKQIEQKLAELEEQSIWDILEKTELGTDKIEEIISDAYSRAILQGVRRFMDDVDVFGMVEAKVNEMEIDELEHLVMTIMKKELDTIVSLGALIGLILGAINIFL